MVALFKQVVLIFYLQWTKFDKSDLMKKITFIILLVAIFTSCKKKEPVPAVSNTGTNTPYSEYTPSNATLFHGIFAISTYTQLTGTNVYSSKYIGAYFSNTPESSFNSSTG